MYSNKHVYDLKVPNIVDFSERNFNPNAIMTQNTENLEVLPTMSKRTEREQASRNTSNRSYDVVEKLPPPMEDP
jgi:hypothetical protein